MKQSCYVSIPFPFYTQTASQCLLLESPTSDRDLNSELFVCHTKLMNILFPTANQKDHFQFHKCVQIFVIPFNILHFEFFTDQNFWKIVVTVILFLWVRFLAPFRSPEWVSSLCKTPNHSLIPLNYFKDVSVQKRIKDS